MQMLLHPKRVHDASEIVMLRKMVCDVTKKVPHL